MANQDGATSASASIGMTVGHAPWRYSTVAFWATTFTLVLFVLAHVNAVLGMFMDGSYFLVQLLQDQRFWDYDTARTNVQFIGQSPVLISMQLGVDSIKTLARIFTFARDFPVVLLYVIALWKVRTNEILFGAFILIVVLNYACLYFMLGEFNLLSALATCALAILVQDKDLDISEGALMVVISVISTRVYEALVIIGPLLFAACMLRAFLTRPKPTVIVALVAAAFFFAAGAALSYWSILYPRDPANAAGAKTVLLALRHQQFVISCIMAAAYLGYVFVNVFVWRMAMIAIFVVGLVAIVLPSNWGEPHHHYFARTLGGLALFGASAIIVLYRFTPLYRSTRLAPPPAFSGILVIGPLLLLVLSMIPNVYFSLGWKRYLISFETEVNAGTGLVPYDKARISAQDTARYGNSWTYPSMSLLLRRSASHAIVQNEGAEQGTWQPFDPKAGVPNLHHYYWK